MCIYTEMYLHCVTSCRINMSPPTVTHRRFCPRGGHTAPVFFGFLISKKSSKLSAVSTSHPAEQLRPIRPGLAHLGDAGKHQQWTMDLESDPEYARIKQLKQHTLKVLRPYFLSPCRKWQKKGSPRNHSNAEVVRPRVYSNVMGSTAEGLQQRMFGSHDPC